MQAPEVRVRRSRISADDAKGWHGRQSALPAALRSIKAGQRSLRDEMMSRRHGAWRPSEIANVSQAFQPDGRSDRRPSVACRPTGIRRRKRCIFWKSVAGVTAAFSFATRRICIAGDNQGLARSIVKAGVVGAAGSDQRRENKQWQRIDGSRFWLFCFSTRSPWGRGLPGPSHMPPAGRSRMSSRLKFAPKDLPATIRSRLYGMRRDPGRTTTYGS